VRDHHRKALQLTIGVCLCVSCLFLGYVRGKRDASRWWEADFGSKSRISYPTYGSDAHTKQNSSCKSMPESFEIEGRGPEELKSCPRREYCTRDANGKINGVFAKFSDAARWVAENPRTEHWPVYEP
jgi:hypothetical protein